MSRSPVAKKLVAIDEEVVPRVHRGTVRPYDGAQDERWLIHQLRRERSAAYWFAASKWGFMGLVIGMCLGAFMMYVATVSTLPIAQDAIARGQTIQDARDAVLGDFSRRQDPAPPAP
jgi:hypothetical protein